MMAPPYHSNDAQQFGTPPSFLMQPYPRRKMVGSQQPYGDVGMDQIVRHDSPTGMGRPPPPQPYEQSGSERLLLGRNTPADSSRDVSPALPERSRPSTRAPSGTPPAAATDSDNQLRFITFNNPDFLRDRGEMRATRKHVMHNYLSKNRKTCGSADPRAERTAETRKRRRTELGPPILPGSSANLQAPASIFDQKYLTPVSSANSRSSSRTRESDGERSVSSAPVSRPMRPTLRHSNTITSEPRILAPAAEQRGTGTRSLASPAGRTPEDQDTATNTELIPRPQSQGAYKLAEVDTPFLQSLLASATESDTPFLQTLLGGRLQPFNAWPTFSDPRINIQRLKHNCIRRFGSHAMSTFWVPAMLKSRHAFLSTMCISAAHESIMQRVANTDQAVMAKHAFEKSRIKVEILAMIKEVLDHPEHRASDGTMIAVLHLLLSEIMEHEPQAMAFHLNGLNKMVALRGGLDNLGARGELAMISTTTALLVAALHEVAPIPMYLAYAQRQPREPPMDGRPVPENPVYCGPKYVTLNRRLGLQSRSLRVLEHVRVITRSWPNIHGRPAALTLRDKIMAFQPKAQAKRTQEAWTYEAVRLTSQLYAQAVVGGVPFSKVHENRSAGQPPVYVQIMRTLRHTNWERCWDHLAGVLLWISLVAGAASNAGARTPFSTDQGGHTGVADECDLARKWFAAVATQCCVQLSFEHPSAVVGTLRRIVEIEQVLQRFGGSGGDVVGNVGGFASQVVAGPVRSDEHQAGPVGDLAMFV